MKGITCCGDCGYYNWQKHKCSRGCKDEGTAQDHFYKDCPMPDVQPISQWIPCSERLPDEPKENPLLEGAKVEIYLVSNGEEFYPFRAFWNGDNFTDGVFKVDVEAWMPLPPAYKEGAE